VEHEALKKQMNQHETAKELDDTEKRLKHNERCVVDIQCGVG
jgi:hypothetical protein